MKQFEVTIPVRTPNPVNGSHRNWRAAAGIRARQKTAALKLIPRLDVEPVVEVRLTRLCAGHLDGDNLGPALKAVRDAVAFRLRVDDESRLVRWVEDQEVAPPGKSAVRVTVRWLVLPDPHADFEEALRAIGALSPTSSGIDKTYSPSEPPNVRRKADEIARRADDKMLDRLQGQDGERP